MSSQQPSGDSQPLVDRRSALAAGFVSAVVLFLGVAFVGQITPFQGLQLLESVLPTVRFLASAGVGAGATVMALMLTLLGLSLTTEYEFSSIHYRRIKVISMLATAIIIISILVLLFVSLPVEEADSLRTYYDVFYYAVLAVASVLGGLMVAISLMLQRTIVGLAAIGVPDGESDLVQVG